LAPGCVSRRCGGLGLAGFGEGEALSAAVLLAGDQALVLQELEGWVDRAGTRGPHPAGTGVDLPDHLVPVHGPLGEQGQDGRPDVVAPAAPAPAPPVVTVAVPAGRAEGGSPAAEGA